MGSRIQTVAPASLKDRTMIRSSSFLYVFIIGLCFKSIQGKQPERDEENRSLDTLGGANLMRSLDSLGGNNLLRTVDLNNLLTNLGERQQFGGFLRPASHKRFDSLGGTGFGSPSNRNFDEIDRSGFNTFWKKRNFDEIDRSGFSNFWKKNLDGKPEYKYKREASEVEAKEQ